MMQNVLSSVKDICTISNGITIARIAMIPSLVRALQLQQWGIALILFSIGAVSDVADGFLARLLNQQTLLGAILDPIADKLLLGACYITWIYYSNHFFTLPNWFYGTIFLKEIILLIGAAFALISYSVPIKPTILGKAAMFLQSIFVGSLLLSAYLNYKVPQAVNVFAGVIVLCTVCALLEYMYIAYKQIGF